MTTNQHREQLMDYLYDELRPDEAQTFEHHLAGCQACQKDVEDFRQVKQSLASWKLEGVPHITLSIEPPPKPRWLDLFRTLPFSLRLASAVVMAMLVVAIFNVRLGYNATDGLQFRASLFPQRSAPPVQVISDRPSEFTEEEVKALIAAAVQQVEQDRDQKIAAQLETLAEHLRSEQRQQLINVAKTLREEQEDRFYEMTSQAQASYTTLTELLGGGANNGY